MNGSNCKFIRILILLYLIAVSTGTARDLNKEIDLSGVWLFEIGDDLNYAKPGYDDSRWSKVSVPSPWENEGFPGYDGYGWYRIKITIPKHLQNKLIYLKLGQIDDVDRTYFNGHLLGGNGDFPPHYQTAYDKNRLYEVPAGFINYGKQNVITVRVYDYHHRGGIVYGDIGIYSRDDVLNLLAGFKRYVEI
ncbi:MAG: beta galactosidase jelly roll domain-containing protein [candidate division KSB1 bacterium]|nr:beta galactosidase jelly roll domain-containing protein [candidate division KSB1 bacterium]